MTKTSNERCKKCNAKKIYYRMCKNGEDIGYAPNATCPNQWKHG